MKTKEDLIDYLEYTEEFSREELEGASSYSLLDTVLSWEGIIGFTPSILGFVRAAYEGNESELLPHLPITSVIESEDLVDEETNEIVQVETYKSTIKVTTLVIGFKDPLRILSSINPNPTEANKEIIEKLNLHLEQTNLRIPKFESLKEVQDYFPYYQLQQEDILL